MWWHSRQGHACAQARTPREEHEVQACLTALHPRRQGDQHSVAPSRGGAGAGGRSNPPRTLNAVRCGILREEVPDACESAEHDQSTGTSLRRTAVDVELG